MLCRTVADVRDAAADDHDGPLTQDQADRVAAILAAGGGHGGQGEPGTSRPGP